VPLPELTIDAVGASCCAPVTQEVLDQDDAERLARTLKALADPARLRLLSIVAAHEKAEACVCDLTEPVGLSQPTVSHHLKVLVDAGFLSRSKRGTWAYYRIVPGSLDAIAATLMPTPSTVTEEAS
jgi:ArsR family transcriptional regulator